MPFIQPYNSPLTAAEAAHLLRRTTAGPTQAEVDAFTGLTATEAVNQLINNINLSAGPPVNLHRGSPDYGLPLSFTEPFDGTKANGRLNSVRWWWLSRFLDYQQPPNLLEKLALFWQNHFVVSTDTVTDYRFIFEYLQIIRQHALGNFRQFIKAIAINAAMLDYLDGDKNTNTSPNENFARELQELFVVGEKNADGLPNYTEQDIKEAARALTGWRHLNYRVAGSTEVGVEFRIARHDKNNKQFSHYYGNTVITGNSTANAGHIELDALINMLLNHPETPKFICRKWYRWFVNTTITQQAEAEVIVPLAQLFASPGNNFEIAPVLRQLLSSQAFFNIENRGALIKSPLELVAGAYRFYQVPVPNGFTNAEGAYRYLNTTYNTLRDMQMPLTMQETVFGFEPYYQVAQSRGWVNSATLAIRYAFFETLANPTYTVTGTQRLGANLLQWAMQLQPNFSDVVATPAISAEFLVQQFTRHLLVFSPSDHLMNVLTDEVFMGGIPRSS
ncbi:MAG TPA: DUF1800 domain-containing protein, partial [Phnomibacter sp.]|nr:DUF1800 domain-containing protein [Phnomibacter sp.]